MAKAETLGVVPDDRGYVFALELTGSRWPAETVTRRVARFAAQTGVSVTISGLRRYSMGRLPALGVDVISHWLGLSVGSGTLPLFASAESLVAADREAARLLGRELDQALASLAPAGRGTAGMADEGPAWSSRTCRTLIPYPVMAAATAASSSRCSADSGTRPAALLRPRLWP
jgi:hypothetical protein